MKDELLKAAKRIGTTVVEEGKKTGDAALALGKEIAHTDTFKDAAKGAAAGAAIAVPVPLIGPITGAVVGAVAGVYAGKKLRHAGDSTNPALPRPDLHSELVKLDDLRQRGLLTDEEFETQKRRLLRILG